MSHRHPANQVIHDSRSRVDAAVDRFVAFFGSLRFIAWMTGVIAAWIVVNAFVVALRWDPYPFILLNLAFSAQATYAAPLILLSQNRQSEHDRLKAEADYETNETALAEIKADRELTKVVHDLTAEVHRLVVQRALAPADPAAISREAAESVAAGLKSQLASIDEAIRQAAASTARALRDELARTAKTQPGMRGRLPKRGDGTGDRT